MILHPLPRDYPRDPTGRQTAIPTALIDRYAQQIGAQALGLYVALLRLAQPLREPTDLDPGRKPLQADTLERLVTGEATVSKAYGERLARLMPRLQAAGLLSYTFAGGEYVVQLTLPLDVHE